MAEETTEKEISLEAAGWLLDLMDDALTGVTLESARLWHDFGAWLAADARHRRSFGEVARATSFIKFPADYRMMWELN